MLCFEDDAFYHSIVFYGLKIFRLFLFNKHKHTRTLSSYCSLVLCLFSLYCLFNFSFLFPWSSVPGCVVIVSVFLLVFFLSILGKYWLSILYHVLDICRLNWKTRNGKWFIRWRIKRWRRRRHIDIDVKTKRTEPTTSMISIQYNFSFFLFSYIPCFFFASHRNLSQPTLCV